MVMMTNNDQHSVILFLWVPVAIFAHLFAAIWLLRALQLFKPALWAKFTSKLGCRRLGSARHQQQDTVGWGAQSSLPLAPVNTPSGAPENFHISARQPDSAYSAAVSAISTASTVAAGVCRQCTPIHSTIGEQTVSTSSEASSSYSTSSSSSNDDTAHVVTVVDISATCQDPYSADPAALSSAASILVKQQLQQISIRQQQEQRPHLQLSWQGIGCTYKTAAGSKAVLQDVWGQSYAGEIQAVLGPSGSGKSHLLDILAYRKTTGSITGDILMNGQRVSSSGYRRLVAYVPQDDNFIPALSTMECLMFYAAMLLPGNQQTPASNAVPHTSPMSSRRKTWGRGQHSSRAAAVDHVLQVVGLSKHGSTVVGGRLPGGLLLRGLSSGERRRLSIAAGILADPAVLFLDEPTSGLDSFAALTVMSHLQDVAHSAGKAVVAAIHQPRSAIWSLFDKVTLLASGLLVYHGPTAGLVPWLSGGLGYCYEPAVHGLVSDWALDLVVVDFDKQQALEGRTMTSVAELQAAAVAFKQQYLEQWKQQEQQLDQQQAEEPTEGVLGNSTPTGQQLAFSSKLCAMIVHRAEMQQHLSEANSQGPFSRGGSSPSSPSGAVIYSVAVPPNDYSSDKSSGSKDSTSISKCSSSSSSSSSTQEQQSIVHSQSSHSSCTGSTSSSRLFTAAARVLQTLTAAPGGIVHASSLQTAENTDANHQPSSRQQQTRSYAVTTPYNSLPQEASNTPSAPTAAASVQIVTTQLPAAVGSTLCASVSSRQSQSSYPSSWWLQYKALAWRELLKVTRNPADVAGRTLTFTWVALLVGLIYYDLPLDASSIRQRLNLLFATLCFFLLMPFISMSMYTDDKGVYLADRAARLYRPVAYYLAKATTVLPFNIVSSLCYSMIQYGMTGMRPGASSVLKHGMIGMLTSLIAVQVLHLAATVTPNQDAAFMMGIGWTCTNLVMSGFFIPYREIRFSALSNLRYLSALHYAFEGLLGVEFGGRTFPCPSAGLDAVSAGFFTQLLPGAANLVTPAMLQGLTNGSEAAAGCVVNSDAVAQYFGFSRSFGVTLGVLVGYLGVLHVVTFVAMLLIARKEAR